MVSGILEQISKVQANTIIIFDSPYDPNGSQIEFTGGEFQTGSGTANCLG